MENGITRQLGEKFTFVEQHPNMIPTIVELITEKSESGRCKGCYFDGWCKSHGHGAEIRIVSGYCSSSYRNDGNNVIFRKLRHL